MSVVREITELGNPILRRKAKPIEDVFDVKILRLAEDMMETLHFAHGVGIAAPQVGESVRLFIVAPDPKVAPVVVINPKIVDHSKTKTKGWEGCLSIPGIRGLVPRFKSIVVEFTDLQGGLVVVEAKDFVARVFQHENDHLDGIIFLDRLENTKDIITDREYSKLFED